ncbi:MAG: hypothetical protein DMH00_05125 [Acidobacteria bacterium]|nr:MAG: hypothetical protein DMH00_05125 [Acidobacteriota bacterium]
MRKRFSPWLDCVLWLLVGWLAIFTASVLTLLVLRALPVTSPARSFLNFVPNLLGIALVLALGLSVSPLSGVEVLSLRRPPWGTLPAVALSTVGLALLGAELDAWMEEILPPPAWVAEIFRRVLEYHDALEFLGVFSFLVVVAPVTEELLFRGLFLHRLREGYGWQKGVLGSALCFGVFHILPWQVVGAVLMGVYLGWLVVKTRSILSSIFSHALFNFVPVVAAGLAPRSPLLQQLSTNDGPVAGHLSWPWILGAGLAAWVGILGIRRLTPPPVAPANS